MVQIYTSVIKVSVNFFFNLVFSLELCSIGSNGWTWEGQPVDQLTALLLNPLGAPNADTAIAASNQPQVTLHTQAGQLYSTLTQYMRIYTGREAKKGVKT